MFPGLDLPRTLLSLTVPVGEHKDVRDNRHVWGQVVSVRRPGESVTTESTLSVTGPTPVNDRLVWYRRSYGVGDVGRRVYVGELCDDPQAGLPREAAPEDPTRQGDRAESASDAGRPLCFGSVHLSPNRHPCHSSRHFLVFHTTPLCRSPTKSTPDPFLSVFSTVNLPPVSSVFLTRHVSTPRLSESLWFLRTRPSGPVSSSPRSSPPERATSDPTPIVQTGRLPFPDGDREPRPAARLYPFQRPSSNEIRFITLAHPSGSFLRPYLCPSTNVRTVLEWS